MRDVWGGILAVARRRGLKPYRYPRQRFNTVMVRLTEVEMNEVWSEFQELDLALRQRLLRLRLKALTYRHVSPARIYSAAP